MNYSQIMRRCGHASIAGHFSELIRLAAEKCGERTVVLVDEYEKPILDNITRPEIAREIRKGLRNLYSVIKGQNTHIRFAILSEVTKFRKISLYSRLNNLRDINLSAGYSAICDYTDADVDTVFAPSYQAWIVSRFASGTTITKGAACRSTIRLICCCSRSVNSVHSCSKRAHLPS